MNTENPEQPVDEKAPESTGTSASNPEFGEIPKDALTMAMLAHLLGAVAMIVGSLIIWIVKKDDHPFIDDQGKEATNFQLTILILHFVAWVLTAITCGLLFFLPLIPWLLGLIMGIVGGMAANTGKTYRYPFCIRFIK